jgi:hypothetical protein
MGLFSRDRKFIPTPASAPTPKPIPVIPFEGFTEDTRVVGHLIGRLTGSTRLSDLLNHREPLPIEAAQCGPILDQALLFPAPGLTEVDPYEFLLVFAGAGTQPDLSSAAFAARKISKKAYDVCLELPPFIVRGQIHLFAGIDPEAIIWDRLGSFFLPVTAATVYYDGQQLFYQPPTVLVQRSALTEIEQIGGKDN